MEWNKFPFVLDKFIKFPEHNFLICKNQGNKNDMLDPWNERKPTLFYEKFVAQSYCGLN